MTYHDRPLPKSEAFIRIQIRQVRRALDAMRPREPREKAEALGAEMVYWMGELRVKAPVGVL